MPGRISKILRQLSLAEHPSGRAIDFGCGRAGPNYANGRLLRFEHRPIEMLSFFGRLSNVHSSGAIRAITGEYNTKIADHEAAGGNACPRCAAMHKCRTGPGCEDCGERHALGSGTTSFIFHGAGNFDLSYTRPNFFSCDVK